ncbi:hypothetical protein RI054_20g88810 [Pseudoscourfieldia marina]
MPCGALLVATLIVMSGAQTTATPPSPPPPLPPPPSPPPPSPPLGTEHAPPFPPLARTPTHAVVRFAAKFCGVSAAEFAAMQGAYRQAVASFASIPASLVDLRNYRPTRVFMPPPPPPNVLVASPPPFSPPPPGYESGDCVVAVADVFVDDVRATAVATALVTSLGLKPGGKVDRLTWGPEDGCPIVTRTFNEDGSAVPFRLGHLAANRFTQVPIRCALDAPVTIESGLVAPPPPKVSRTTTSAKKSDKFVSSPWFVVVIVLAIVLVAVIGIVLFRRKTQKEEEVKEVPPAPSAWSSLKNWRGRAAKDVSNRVGAPASAIHPSSASEWAMV